MASAVVAATVLSNSPGPLKRASPADSVAPPAAKRARVSAPPDVSGLDARAAVVTKQELWNAVKRAFARHPDLDLQLRADVLAELPEPDFRAEKARLDSLQCAYWALKPRYASGNNFTFNRISRGLRELKAELIHICAMFDARLQHDLTLRFLTEVGLGYAKELPEWDDCKNNRLKEHLFKRLDTFALKASKALAKSAPAQLAALAPPAVHAADGKLPKTAAFAEKQGL